MRIPFRTSGLSRSLGVAIGLFLLAAMIPPPAEASAVPVIYHGSRLRPYIALTIDDGYNAYNCRAIADILKARNVPATFFPYSRAVTNAPWSWRHISSEGFAIADHSVSHPWMTRLSYAGQLWQIRTAKSQIQTVIGTSIAPLFRPPYGSWNYNTRLAAGAAGIRYIVLWDTSFADTATMSDASHYYHATRGINGSIILAHCGPASTVRIMARVVAFYKARGYRFVTVAQLLGLQPISSAASATSGASTSTPTGSSIEVGGGEQVATASMPEAILTHRIEIERWSAA